MRCLTCFRPLEFCLCSIIKKFSPRSKIIILIHPMEAKKEKLGTGRITRATLENSEIIMGIDFTDDGRVNELINDDRYLPLVLYPGEDAISATVPTEADKIKLQEKIPLIFAIDGTWPCAKKMMKLSKNINILPRISFDTDKKSEFLIKHQPHEKALSTIESVHVLLDHLNNNGLEDLNGAHDNLITVFKKMIAMQIEVASDPNRPSYRGKNMSADREQLIIEKKNRSFIYNK